MLYFEKSQPAPTCLIAEQGKASGDYKCGEVLERLKADFKNKCYLCEKQSPSAINVEHLVSHQGNKALKFSWDNLF
ncbi:MAG: HNH endonuclease, partial [Methyloprofundus sp.]|nr:HNH endonuclease [Methyloprofundus sp.]